MPARQPMAYSPRDGPLVISGLVPAGGDVGGAEAEREFHQQGPVVHAGFEVGGRGGHTERGQPVGLQIIRFRASPCHAPPAVSWRRAGRVREHVSSGRGGRSGRLCPPPLHGLLSPRPCSSR